MRLYRIDYKSAGGANVRLWIDARNAFTATVSGFIAAWRDHRHLSHRHCVAFSVTQEYAP